MELGLLFNLGNDNNKGEFVPPPPAAPVNVAAPVISGNPYPSYVLQCSVGRWSGWPSPSFSYQWKKGGVAISGATGSTYTVVSGDVDAVITCTVTATNTEGSASATSAGVTVVLLPVVPSVVVMPVISGTPNPGSVLSCTNGTWTGTPTPTLTRQWTRNSTPISGATNSTYTLQAQDEGAIVSCTVTATNVAGSASATAEGVVVIVPTEAPVNTSAPVLSGTPLAGNTLTVSTGSWTGIPAPTFTYQWRRNGTDIAGATTNSFNIPSTGYTGAVVDCRVTATNTAGSAAQVSNSVTITVNTLPAFLTHPQTQTVLDGHAVTLTASAGGTPTPTYQWQVNTGSGWTNITGATSASYTSANLALADTGIQYRCVATNTVGSVNSDVATVTVQENYELVLDTSYVDTGSSKYTTFKAFVDAALSGSPGYGFVATDAVFMYLLTGLDSYRTLAINTLEVWITAAENQIAAGQAPTSYMSPDGPDIMLAADSYLHVGKNLADIAAVYAFCGLTQGQKDRYAAIADQAVFNVWNPSSATWGGNSFPWSGWSINNPGNNYFYSFLQATCMWGLASNNPDMVDFANNVKWPQLQSYFANLQSGGSREGTAYGLSHRSLFALYKIWNDSGQGAKWEANSHLDNSIHWWIHATLPTLNVVMPIGDQARVSYPAMFDYHRELMLYARYLTIDPTLQSDASWWLNNISVQNMSQGFERRHNLLPAGSNTSTPPTELTYYSPSTGHIFTRTGWGTDAMYMAFTAGTYDESHAHQDQGCFTLFKDSFLTVTNNIWSTSGINQECDYQNTLRFMTSTGTTIPQNYGTSVMSTPTIGAGGAVSASANMKPVYNSSLVSAWTRSIDFTSEGVLTVQDSYSTTGGATAAFQLQLPVEPTIVGNVITAGDFKATVIQPATPTITYVSANSLNSNFNNGYRVSITGGAGTYQVQMGLAGGEEPTETAPVFTVQPADTTIDEGASATFTASAFGNPNPTYQWQSNATGSWADISGATSNSYTTPVLAVADTGAQFRCVATNSQGSATSDVATVTVQEAEETPMYFGSKVTGPQTASSDSDRAFLDRFNMPVSGTTTQLSIWCADISTAGSSCKGLIYSDNAGYPGNLIAVGSAVPVPAGGGWVVSPMSVGLTPGNYWIGVVFNSFEADIGYGANNTGSSPDSVRVEGPGRGGTFSYANPPATMPAGAASIYATVDLPVFVDFVDGEPPADETPVFTTNPASTSITENNTVTLTAYATGVPTPTYQWQTNTGSWVDIAGATSPSYTSGVLTLANDGVQYRCMATNRAGSATSSVATITVNEEGTAPTEDFFGSKDISGTERFPGDDGRMLASKYTVTDVDITDANVHFRADADPACTVRTFIYSDNAGVPGTLVLSAPSAVSIVPGGWVSVPMSGHLPAGVYHLAVAFSHFNANISVTTTAAGQGNLRLNTSGTINAPPNPWGTTAASYDSNMAAYVNVVTP